MKDRPSSQIMFFVENERQVGAQELKLLEQSADLEAAARSLKGELDQVRGALRALSGTWGHAEAEALFLGLAASNMPTHVATQETTDALELRKRALVARRKALLAETTALLSRRERMEALAMAIATARETAASLSARVAAERAAGVPPVAAINPGADTAPTVTEPVAAPAPEASPPEGASASASPWQAPRVHKRVSIERMVTVTSEAGTLVGFCRNLSVGGMLLTTYDKLLPAGTQIEVTLTLSGRPLRIPATVRYVRQSGESIGMGICFSDPSPETEVALYAFLSELDAEFWEKGE